MDGESDLRLYRNTFNKFVIHIIECNMCSGEPNIRQQLPIFCSGKTKPNSFYHFNDVYLEQNEIMQQEYVINKLNQQTSVLSFLFFLCFRLFANSKEKQRKQQEQIKFINKRIMHN